MLIDTPASANFDLFFSQITKVQWRKMDGEGGPPYVGRALHLTSHNINTKVRWLGKTVKQTATWSRFSNCFYVRLKRKVCEFHGVFWWFFGYSLSRLMGDASIFCQMKSLMKIHKCCTFHEDRICGCQVIDVQMFWWQQKLHLQGASGWFFIDKTP